MSERRNRLTSRNDKIRKDYMDIYKEGYRHEYVINKLEKRYYLSRDTLERIVKQSGVYKKM